MGGRRRVGYGIDPERLAELIERQSEARAAAIARSRKRGAERAAETRAAKKEADFLERRKKRAADWHKARGGRQAWEPIGPLAGWKLLAAAMAPGAWYGQPDLVALSSAPAGSVKAWLAQKLEARGLVERGLNPAWDPERPARRQAEPRYLWRLSEAGTAAAAGWRAELVAAAERAPAGLLDDLL